MGVVVICRPPIPSLRYRLGGLLSQAQPRVLPPTVGAVPSPARSADRLAREKGDGVLVCVCVCVYACVCVCVLCVLWQTRSREPRAHEQHILGSARLAALYGVLYAAFLKEEAERLTDCLTD